MAHDPPPKFPLQTSDALTQWLMDSDPSIRWQVMRDLTDAPENEVAAERANVATQGRGAQLLGMQARDGTWGGTAWNRGWTSTLHALTLLYEFGLDPQADPTRRALDRVREQVTWRGCGPNECANHPFFDGEVEPCINGQVAVAGAYFAQDVRRIIERLLREQLPDGGWNCEVENGSGRSSFNTTICVLEALLEFEERNGHRRDVSAARRQGEAYLLERRLFRRKSTGSTIDFDRKTGPGSTSDQPAWTRFAFPTWWHYDLLRGLEYFRKAGAAPEERMAEAMDWVRSKRDAEGRWLLEVRYPGPMLLEIDPPQGQPSRWNTLRALRVLRWYSEGKP
ncbi:MAG: terpene cyclase/mutase family protein [Verrucomicrobiales bacterium]|nr:terpene cyclase/mutase family protein [Verrucomicrobiales bacterium]